jgi:hypothetical protein
MRSYLKGGLLKNFFLCRNKVEKRRIIPIKGNEEDDMNQRLIKGELDFIKGCTKANLKNKTDHGSN